MTKNSIKKFKARYDNVASNYDSDFKNILKASHKASVEQILKHMNSCENVLDISVGTGNFLLRLSKKIKCENYTGSDLSQEMLNIAAKKIPFKWTMLNENALNIQKHIPSHSQDLIVCQFMYDYVPYEKLLPIFFDLLKPGGFVSISTTTKEHGDDIKKAVDKNKILSKLFDVETAIKNSSVVESHQAHLDIINSFKFSVKEQFHFIIPMEFKDAKEIWFFGNKQGWASRYFASCSKLKLAFLKYSLYLLGFVFSNVFPAKGNLHISQVLIQKPKSNTYEEQAQRSN